MFGQKTPDKLSVFENADTLCKLSKDADLWYRVHLVYYNDFVDKVDHFYNEFRKFTSKLKETYPNLILTWMDIKKAMEDINCDYADAPYKDIHIDLHYSQNHIVNFNFSDCAIRYYMKDISIENIRRISKYTASVSLECTEDFVNLYSLYAELLPLAEDVKKNKNRAQDYLEKEAVKNYIEMHVNGVFESDTFAKLENLLHVDRVRAWKKNTMAKVEIPMDEFIRFIDADTMKQLYRNIRMKAFTEKIKEEINDN